MRVAAGFLLAVAWAIQSAAPARPMLHIDSPADGSYISGPILLRAIVDPPAGVASIAGVTFFVDGKSVCRLERPPYECEWFAGDSVTSHQVRAVAALNDGSRIVHTVRTKEASFAERVEVDVVQVTATVTDTRGHFVSGLTEKAFRVFEDDVPQKVTYFAAENIPLEIVAAVDISSSMTDAMPVLKGSVKRFLGRIRQGDQVTLLAFNDNIFTLARRETNPTTRQRAVDRLAPWGSTAFYDVILKGLDLLGRQQGRRVLVIFTDGDDKSSHTTIENVERRVEASDATLYLIGLGRATKTSDLQRILGRLARVSGGRTFYPERIDQVDEVFTQITDELAKQYLLAYPPTNERRDGSWRRIKVELVNANHKVRARQGYRAVGRK